MPTAKKPGGLAQFMTRQVATDPQPADAAVPTNAKVDSPAPSRVLKSGRRSLRDGRVQHLSYLFPDGVKQLKRVALDTDRSESDIVREAINEWFQRHGFAPLA